DAAAVRATGVSEDGLVDAIRICALFSMIVRLADSLGWDIPPFRVLPRPGRGDARRRIRARDRLTWGTRGRRDLAHPASALDPPRRRADLRDPVRALADQGRSLSPAAVHHDGEGAVPPRPAG